MKKKLLFVLLTVLVVIGMMPMQAAAEDYAAYIGTTGYTTVQAAVNAASEMTGDVTVTLAAKTIAEDVTIGQTAGVNLTLSGSSEGTTVLDGMLTVDGNGRQSGTETLTIENITFDGDNDTSSEYDASIYSPDRAQTGHYSYSHNVTVKNCTFKDSGTTTLDVAAIRQGDGGCVNWLIKDCTMEASLHSLLQLNNINGLTVDNCKVYAKNGANLVSSNNVEIKNSTFAVSGYAVRLGAGGSAVISEKKVTLTNNTISTTSTEDAAIVIRNGASDAQLTMSGNSVTTASTAHVATDKVTDTSKLAISVDANYWGGAQPTVEGVTVTVNSYYSDAAKTNLVKIVNGLTGDGSSTSPYLINNLAELEWFRDSVNSGKQYTGQYVALTADIDLSGLNWTPIGNMNIDKRSFQGYFDGRGHVISNLYIEKAENGLGFFGCTGAGGDGPKCEIKNLTLNNVTVKSTITNSHGGSYVGGLIANARATTTLDNIKVTGTIDIEGYGYVGGIVGHAYPTIKNCRVEGTGTVRANYWCAGAILGYGGEGSTKITNCSVIGTGTGLNVHGVYGGAASVCGAAMEGGTIDTVSVKNVNVTANSDYLNGYVRGYSSGVSNVKLDNVTLTVNGKPVTPIDVTAMIGDQVYPTLSDAITAAAADEDATVIQLFAGTFEEGTIKLPASLKNVTIKGAADKASVLKNTVLQSSDGDTICYEGITIDGVIFDNSRILLTGWRNGAVSYKNWTITNCEFKNIVTAAGDNSAAFHHNVEIKNGEAMNGFTFTNNVIDGVSGGSNSGLYMAVTGTVLIDGNTINDVAFRPYVIQVNDNDGIADTLTVTNNTFSGSDVGRAQAYGDMGTDNVKLVITGNAFKDITNAQQICYWGFSDAVTYDFSKNYYSIDVANLPGKIYYNGGASAVLDLVNLGIYPLYTRLNADGTIDESSLIYGPVAAIDVASYNTLEAAYADAANGKTIDLLSDVTVTEKVDLMAKGLTLNQNGKAIILSGNGYLTSAAALSVAPAAGYELITLGNDTEGYIYKISSVTYTVTVTNGFGSGLYAAEQTVSIMASAPISGYVFDKWVVVKGDITLNTTLPNTTFTMPAGEVEITATYKKDVAGDAWYVVLMHLYNQKFNVTAVATEGGTITPAGVSEVKYNQNITYTIAANDGYTILDVVVDGESVGAVSEYTFSRVKDAHTITATFAKTAWTNPFTDVKETDSFYADVAYVCEKGLMNGTGETTFEPSAALNRAMIVTTLWRLEGSPTVESPVDFFDVPAAEWYTEAIRWASANGIVNGYGDGTFGPTDDLTREQAIAILYRYAQYKKYDVSVGENTNILSYTDVQSISEYAIPAMQWACGAGIAGDRGNGTLDPLGEASRADIAVYLHRFCETVK